MRVPRGAGGNSTKPPPLTVRSVQVPKEPAVVIGSDRSASGCRRMSRSQGGSMRKKLRGTPAMVIAVIALFVALGGGYAIGAGFIGTGDLKNQAVTNKKIKKKTIKANRVKPDTLTGDQINEASLSGAGTALQAVQGTAATVPGATTTQTPVLTLQVPKAGSYVFFSKGVLARATTGNVQCLLTAGGDSDRSLEVVDSANNTTAFNMVAHTFSAPGAVTLSCDNPGAGILLVTDKRIEGIPVGALSS